MATHIHGFSGFHRAWDVRACPDCVSVMERTPRTPVMRLVPGSKLYRCTGCGGRLFSTLGLKLRLK